MDDSFEGLCKDASSRPVLSLADADDERDPRQRSCRRQSEYQEHVARAQHLGSDTEKMEEVLGKPGLSDRIKLELRK